MSFTLEYGATNQSLEAWGIERANITFRSLARGELVLTVKTLDANADPIFAYKGKVTIWQGSTKRFVGWVTSLPVFASERTESHTYAISDGWWWLEQITFQDVSGPFYDESNAGTTPLWEYCSMFTVGITGQTLSVGGPIYPKTIGAIVRDSVLYAANSGAPITAASSAIENYAFLESARDITCADLIRRALNWSPTAATWWDVSGSTPALNCKTRGYLSDVSVALDGTVAQSWELVPRYDMQVGQVTLYVLRTRRRDDGTEYVTLKTEGSSGAFAAAGSLVASIVMGTADDGTEEAIPSGIASRLYNDLSVLQWEGKIVCVENECSFFALPGSALNFTGAKARTAWNTMRATIQQADYDLVTGRSVISFGPPSHLSPQDLIAIANSAKKNRPPTNPANPGGGPGGGGGGGDGTGPKPKAQTIELCDGTTLNVLTVSGSVTA